MWWICSLVTETIAASTETMASVHRLLTVLLIVYLEAVLMKLPLSSLLVCYCVSKSLLNLKWSKFCKNVSCKIRIPLMISSPLHSRFHLIDLDANSTPAFAERVEINSSFNLPLRGFKVRHSCNGLVLWRIVTWMMMFSGVWYAIQLQVNISCFLNLTFFPKMWHALFYWTITNLFKIFRAIHLVFRPIRILNLSSIRIPIRLSNWIFLQNILLQMVMAFMIQMPILILIPIKVILKVLQWGSLF